jgi:hypothetical protein
MISLPRCWIHCHANRFQSRHRRRPHSISQTSAPRRDASEWETANACLICSNLVVPEVNCFKANWVGRPFAPYQEESWLFSPRKKARAFLIKNLVSLNLNTKGDTLLARKVLSGPTLLNLLWISMIVRLRCRGLINIWQLSSVLAL